MKLFASDFDGTLFHRSPVSTFSAKEIADLEKEGYRRKDIEAIKTFQKNGNLFGLCTGRSLPSLLDFMHEEIRPDFIIASSGAVVSDGNGQILDEKTIPASSAEKLLELLPKTGLSITTKNHFYVSRDMSFLSQKPEWLDEFRPESDEIICVSCNVRDTALAQKLKESIDKIEGVSVFLNQHCLDCVPDGCSKAHGIEFVRDYFQAAPEKLFAAGDSFNDLPMADAVNCFYTFEDCPQALKKKAVCITDGIEGALEDSLRRTG